MLPNFSSNLFHNLERSTMKKYQPKVTRRLLFELTSLDDTFVFEGINYKRGISQSSTLHSDNHFFFSIALH